MATSALIHLSSNTSRLFGSKSHASVGIDFQFFASAPGRKALSLDVDCVINKNEGLSSAVSR